MKKTFLFILSLIFASTYLCDYIRAAASQPLPEIYEGSMMPYDFTLSDTTAVWDSSFRPVYAAYIARHGARYITSAKKIESLQTMLYDKAMTSALTTAGERMLKLLGEVGKRSAGKWGELSDVGIYEQHRLAGQMKSLLPGLVNNGNIYACATFVPRVIMTMDQFCWKLGQLDNSVELYQGGGERFDSLLRFFDTDKEYARWRSDGEWKQVVNEFIDNKVPVEPALKLLGKNTGLSADSLRKITMMEYDVLQSLRAFGMSGPDDYFMSESEYYDCWSADNLELYLRNTISPLNTSCAGAASYLLNTIIRDADAACSDDDSSFRRSASLYFGHAETLMPLFSLMNLPGCRALPLDYYDLPALWKVYDVAPLGANLLIVLLKDSEDRLMAAARLNGKFIELIPGEGLLTSWQTIRDYWQHQMEAFNTL